VLLRLILGVGFCVRPADYLAQVSAEVYVKAENNFIAPAGQRNSVFRKIMWKPDRFRRRWTLVRGILQDRCRIPFEGFVGFSDVR